MRCLTCGCQIPDESHYCPDCGIKVDGRAHANAGGWYYPEHETGIIEHPQDQGATSGGNKSYPGIRDGMNLYIRPERDIRGRAIPREYPPFFNRNAWCWPGFWFPALWCCYKGIYKAAWKYILIGFIPSIGGSIASVWCGVAGYNEYASFIEDNPSGVVTQAKSTGMGCFWLLLLGQIVWQVISAIILALFIMKYIAGIVGTIPLGDFNL